MRTFHHLTDAEIAAADLDALYVMVRSWTLTPGLMCSAHQWHEALRALAKLDPGAIDYITRQTERGRGRWPLTDAQQAELDAVKPEQTP